VIIDLGKAYDDFFAVKPVRYTKAKLSKAARTGKKLTPYDLDGHPKFKSIKDNDYKFPIRIDHTYFIDPYVNIEKIGKVKYQTDKDLPQGKNACGISNPRIKYKSGKWMLSFGIERENQAYDLTEKSLGIDLGIKTTAVVSFGGDKIEFHNINKSRRVRRLERKRKHVQRNLSRKYRKNGNYAQTQGVKEMKALSLKIDNKLSDIRKDYTHKTTKQIVSLRPKRIVMENLSVKNLMKNRHLAKAIADQNWAEFIRQMKYKSEWNGISFIQADKFYPSSKMCSCCGNIKKDLKLKDRIYVCNVCGTKMDRDYNAAINLERYGLPKEKGQSA